MGKPNRANVTLEDEFDNRDLESDIEALRQEEEMKAHLVKTHGKDPRRNLREIEVRSEANKANLPEADIKGLMGSTLTPFVPTPTHIRFAEELILSEKMSTYKSIAKRLGCSEKTVYMWFQDPGFRLWIDEMRMLMYTHVKPHVDKKLIRMALKGSYKHMELFYTLTGDLKKEEKTEMWKGVQVDSMTTHEQYVAFQRTVSSLTGTMKPTNGKSVHESPRAPDTKEDSGNDS